MVSRSNGNDAALGVGVAIALGGVAYLVLTKAGTPKGYASLAGPGIVSSPNPVTYRTSGDGCGAGYDILSDGRKYFNIRNYDPAYPYVTGTTTTPLSTTGEAIVAIVDPSVPGLTLDWYAQVNAAALDTLHNTVPMCMEDAPGGYNFIGFFLGQVTTAGTILNGVATEVPITAPTPDVPHRYTIKIVTPGQLVDFYIDEVLVATITTNIPTSPTLLAGTELDQDNPTQDTALASLWTFGGILS